MTLAEGSTHGQTQRSFDRRAMGNIEALLPRMRRSRLGGRPWMSHRAVVDGIVWVLRTDARWRDLPAEYPSPALVKRCVTLTPLTSER